MDITTDWQEVTGLWGFILLAVHCICLASTLQYTFLIDPQYTCYDGDFLCPVLHGGPTLRCGQDCFLFGQYT